MTETHETKRQVAPDEKHFWQRLKISLENSEFIQISSTQVAENNTSIHQQRARQIVATWDNEGLVASSSSHNTVMLTEYGKSVDVIEGKSNKGESWR